MLDDTLLDSKERLAEADAAGLLRAAAMAGAQVRATTEQAAEVGLTERLDLGRPRALVLLARPGPGRTAIRLLAELLAASASVPVVTCEVVPSWIGALDVVFAHGDDAGDRELAASLERAARYGATVVVSAPPDGPVASAVAGRGLLLAPRLALPAELAFPRALAAGLITANTLGLLTADVHSLADQLDAEAERGHPAHDSFANPAKALALRIAEHTPLLWGLDHIAVALGGHAAHTLAAHAATVSDVADYRQALARPALLYRAHEGGAERDIFADPDDQPASEQAPPRVLLLAVRTGPAAQSARQHAGETLGDVDIVAPVEDSPADEATRAAVVALRFELAAIYLGLAAGTIGGMDRRSHARV